MPPKAQSPARPAGRSPQKGRPEESAQKLAERVKELEAAEKETKKTQAKDQKQRQRELADAKKKIAKELQAASRLVQKGEREANRLTTKADQVEKQAEQAKQKAARQQAMVEESAARMRAKRNGLEATLQEKMSGIGEAKGRLAHAAFAAKMLEAGVIVPLDGTADIAELADAAEKQRLAKHKAAGCSTDGVERAGAADAGVGDDGDLWPEAAMIDDVDGASPTALQEENSRLRASLRQVRAEIAALKATMGAPAAPAEEAAAAEEVTAEQEEEDEEEVCGGEVAVASAEEAPADEAIPPLTDGPIDVPAGDVLVEGLPKEVPGEEASLQDAPAAPAEEAPAEELTIAPVVDAMAAPAEEGAADDDDDDDDSEEGVPSARSLEWAQERGDGVCVEELESSSAQVWGDARASVASADSLASGSPARSAASPGGPGALATSASTPSLGRGVLLSPGAPVATTPILSRGSNGTSSTPSTVVRLGGAHVGSAPVGSAPVGSAHIGSTHVGSAHVGSAHVLLPQQPLPSVAPGAFAKPSLLAGSPSMPALPPAQYAKLMSSPSSPALPMQQQRGGYVAPALLSNLHNLPAQAKPMMKPGVPQQMPMEPLAVPMEPVAGRPSMQHMPGAPRAA